MPREPRKPAAPKPPPLFSREEIVGLCKRFLKPDAYDPVESPKLMYRIVKLYPNRDFWQHFQLGFKLNYLLFLLGKDGREKLNSAWAQFTLDMAPQDSYALEEVKQGPDIQVPKKPRTVAELLKS